MMHPAWYLFGLCVFGLVLAAIEIHSEYKALTRDKGQS